MNAEAGIVRQWLSNSGWELTTDPAKADVCVLFTCGVTTKRERQYMESIEALLPTLKPDQQVVVTGCLPGINPELFGSFRNVLLVPSKELSTLSDLLGLKKTECFTASNEQALPDLVASNIPIAEKIKSRLRFNVAFLRFLYHKLTISRIPVEEPGSLAHILISKGCLSNCAFCAIKKAQGSLQSIPLETIIKSFTFHLRQGKKLFKLVSSDSGCWGLDRKSNVIELFSAICDLDYAFEILIKDFNPVWVSRFGDELSSIFKRNHGKIRVFEVPLQSGAQKMINKMNRGHDIESTIRFLRNIKAMIPSLKITTQLMVGFPGETDGDFQRTLELARDPMFYDIQCYNFDPRPGTVAFGLPNQVPQKNKK